MATRKYHYGGQAVIEGVVMRTADRWALVAYVRALQRSQGATVADVPAELQRQLR